MKAGDLVVFNPPSPGPGALTAVKFFNRLEQRVGWAPGIIIEMIDSTTATAYINGSVQLINTNFFRLV